MQDFKINRDTSGYRKQVKDLLESGRRKFNSGSNINMKDEGVRETLQALQTMKMWIEGSHNMYQYLWSMVYIVEQDHNLVKTLKEQFKAIHKELGSQIDYIEKTKSGKTTLVEGNNHQKGGGGNNDDGDTYSNAIMDSIVSEKPNVKWDDIAGLKNAKAMLQDAVILPIKFPQIFQGALKPWKGILMYGPPGTGKTFLAKACATEAQATFFSVSSSDLVSKYVGDSEKLIKSLFNLARQKKPSIIFIDEIDSICGQRGEGQNETSKRVINEFLVQMQGVGHDDRGVLVLGATNIPWGLDSAIRRRFEKRVFIPLPEVEARQTIIQNNLKNNMNQLNQEQFKYLAEKTDGFSGSDVSILVRDAAYMRIRLLQSTKYFRQVYEDGINKYIPVEQKYKNEPGVVEIDIQSIDPNQLKLTDITYDDFIEALKTTKPTVAQSQLKQFEDWTNEFGQEG